MKGKVLLLILQFLIANCVVTNNATYSFDVYWNVPSELCNKYKMYFNLSEFGIVQNTGDKFMGDKIRIFYGPGRFPHFVKGKSIDGGIPQLGNILYHVQEFRNQIHRTLPRDFKGIAILDFEDYKPIYDHIPILYMNKSLEYAKKLLPKSTDQKIIETYAKRSFEDAARKFFQTLLYEGMSLRPEAKFGYYGYPNCKAPNYYFPECDPTYVKASDEMFWLFPSSGALFPSIYMYKNSITSSVNRALRVYDTVKLAKDIRWKNKQLKQPILPYFWFKYHDETDTFLTEADLLYTFLSIVKLGVNGIVIWGSSNDVSNSEQCQKLQDYVTEVLGPILLFARSSPSSHSPEDNFINSLLTKQFANSIRGSM